MLTKHHNRKKLFSTLNIWFVASSLFILTYSLFIDIFTGAIFENFIETFFVRAVSIFVISYLVSFYLVRYFFEKKKIDYISVIKWSFSLQFIFWLATFFSPEMKIALTMLMGGNDNSVNLRSHNLAVRGFGFSGEINYTTPFMTAVVSLLIIKDKVVSTVSVISQLINSNFVLVAALIGLFFSKNKIHIKILLVTIGISMVYLLGDDIFRRLSAEFKGEGSRTASTLINNHIQITNNGFIEHLAGTHEYTFKKGATVRSDIGWVNMYNYGGWLFVIAYTVFIMSLSYLAFGYNLLSVAWFGIAVTLNSKGILFGPNSFYLITFILIFLRKSKNDTPSCC